jgi:hypothetical protein
VRSAGLTGLLIVLCLALASLASGSTVSATPAVIGCLNGEIVGSAAAPGRTGYWLVGGDGGVFAFGTAQFYGSAATLPLNQPVVGIVPTADGGGYWLIAADGGVFAYGNATPIADNPLPTTRLNQPIVAAARAGQTNGLWLTAGDGGVFALNGAPFYGSAATLPLNQPVVGIVPTADGGGYWLIAADGGVFAYQVDFYGSAVPNSCSTPPPNGGLSKVVAIATDIMNGRALPGWGGGPVPYSWGGGHGRTPGPSLGTCEGYRGSITPCPSNKTVGVDCSGFTRWVYALAFGRDVFGGVTAGTQASRLQKVSVPQAADLVYYRTRVGEHIGIYTGNGQMINALQTGTNVKINRVSDVGGFVGYFRYNG